MIKSKYDDVELAARFIEMSEKFLAIYKNERTVLNFGEPHILHNICGTTACHGGFAALVLKAKPRPCFTAYELGAEALALFFGFTTASELSNWAGMNVKTWGGMNGGYMFHYRGYIAFGYDLEEEDDCTLLTIAAWYANVAARLLGVTPK